MFLRMSILVLLIGHAQFSRDQLRKEHDGAIEGARLREIGMLQSDRQGEREKEVKSTSKRAKDAALYNKKTTGINVKILAL